MAGVDRKHFVKGFTVLKDMEIISMCKPRLPLSKLLGCDL